VIKTMLTCIHYAGALLCLNGPLFNPIRPLLNLIRPLFSPIRPLFNLIRPLFNPILPLFNPILPVSNPILALFNRRPLHCARLCIGFCIGLMICTPSQAQYLEEIGLLKLDAELGPLMPTGAGTTVYQVEAPNGETPEGYPRYIPDYNNPAFQLKSFIDRPGYGAISAHATDVGKFFYGIDGIAPGVETIILGEANDWYINRLLRTNIGGQGAPLLSEGDIHNHSWIANRTNNAPPEALEQVIKVTRLMDYLVLRDGPLVVVTVNNKTYTTIPDLFAHSYNCISVGTSDGDHSRGATTFDGLGRIKPEIVAPTYHTSYAAPMVSGTAASLLEVINEDPALTDAGKPECLKAILLAGATKQEFPAWSRQVYQPLDSVFGAGELNVYNSYHILAAGRQKPSATEPVLPQGWDLNQIGVGPAKRYFFDIPETHYAYDVSMILTWLRDIRDIDPSPTFTPEADILDLDLRLFNVEPGSFVTGEEIDKSISLVDNIEHVYQEILLPGRYCLEVSGDTGGVSKQFALAFRSEQKLLPNIVEIAPRPDKRKRILAKVEADIMYRFEKSTDLESWTPIGTQLSTGTLITSLTAIDEEALQFYRVLPVAP